MEQAHARDEERAVVVRLGSVEFGLDVRRVREVLRVPPITRLPFPPPTILGIVSIRGTLVPVMDLGLRLLDRAADRQGRLVVVREPDRDGLVGLLVDEVLDLVPLEQATIDPPDEVEASLPAGWILGVLSPDANRLVTMLDLTSILDIQNLAAEEKR
jgi:chemotaxis signal transduction protein